MCFFFLWRFYFFSARCCAIRHCQNPTPHGRTWLKVQRWCPCSLKSMHKRPVSEVQDRSFLWGYIVVLRDCGASGGPVIFNASEGPQGEKIIAFAAFFWEGSCDLINLLVHWLCIGPSFSVGLLFDTFIHMKIRRLKLPKGRCQELFVFCFSSNSRYVQPATSTHSQLTWFQALLGVLKGCTAHEVGKWLIGIRIWVFWFLIKISSLSFKFSRSPFFFLSFFSLSFGFVTRWNFITLTFVISSLVYLDGEF